MQITIDTSLPLNDVERGVLSLLLTGEVTLKGETVKDEPKAKPAKKAAAKKKVEPEPDPAAEEPIPDEPEEEVDEADEDETSDEDLLTLAVKKATEMVAGGDAAKVREALDAAGASRVRELNADNVREFFKALS